MVKADQYERHARRWSETQYADSAAYLAHRARLVVGLGPQLRPGDTVLDLACGDGGLAGFLAPYGVVYRGADSTAAMVEEARRNGVEAALGDLNDYRPPEPVQATTCFRALYYATDRTAFFRHVASYTVRKLVFDLNPRQYRLDDVRAELREAGFRRIETRPFFVPQNVALPWPASAILRGVERSGPLARLALRARFTYLVAAAV